MLIKDTYCEKKPNILQANMYNFHVSVEIRGKWNRHQSGNVQWEKSTALVFIPLCCLEHI